MPGIRAMAGAGMRLVSVSLDGLEDAHDRIRSRGSFRAATQAIDRVVGAGMRAGSNTSLNRVNRADLEGLRPLARAQSDGLATPAQPRQWGARRRAGMLLQQWISRSAAARGALKRRALLEAST